MAATAQPTDRGAGLRAVTAVGYLRRSTDRQEQSIPDQQRALETHCREHGLTLLRCYTDDAISGTSTVGRHAFQQMMADAQRPGPGGADFGVIVVYDVKRFGRVDNDEAGYYRHVLRQHGVSVHYASENFAGDGTDDLMRPVKQWQARQESKDLSKVTIRGLLSKSGTGHWMGGAPPYGYDLRYATQSGEFLFYLRYRADGSKVMYDARWRQVRVLARGETVAVSRKDHCTLMPGDPARVGVVRKIFRWYVERGMGYKAIAERLNRENVPPARGPAWAEHYSGQWAMMTVRAVLVNPAYRGDVVWNRRTDARFHRIQNGVAVERKDAHARRLEPNDPVNWTVVRGAHPPLVSPRTWELAQNAMRGKAASIRQRGIDQRRGAPASDYRRIGDLTGPRARFLLSKLVVCARCGSRYEGYAFRHPRPKDGGERPKTFGYACGGSIRRGRSVCGLGFVRQEALEDAVVRAVVGFYGRYRGAEGARRLGRELRTDMGLEGDDIARTEARVRRELAKLDAKVRRLLDGATPVTQAAVERRYQEVEAERAALKARLESLERLGMSRAEVRDLTEEATGFLARLEASLREGTLHERQGALRRCVVGIEFGGPGAASAEVRVVPVIAADRLPRTEPVEVQVSSNGAAALRAADRRSRTA
ncbi:MAG: recombinase family protein [Phycisphaerales bacterium]